MAALEKREKIGDHPLSSWMPPLAAAAPTPPQLWSFPKALSLAVIFSLTPHSLLHELIHSHCLSSCFSPTPNSYLWGPDLPPKLASSLIKRPHPGGRNSLPSLGSGPSLGEAPLLSQVPDQLPKASHSPPPASNQFPDSSDPPLMEPHTPSSQTWQLPPQVRHPQPSHPPPQQLVLTSCLRPPFQPSALFHCDFLVF